MLRKQEVGGANPSAGLKNKMNFKNLLKEAKVDAILLFNFIERNDSNFVYLSGLKEIDALFLIMENPVLYASILEIEGIKERDFLVKPHNKDTLGEINNNFNGKTLGLNYNFVTINEMEKLKEKLKDVEFIDVSNFLREKRSTKSEEEIKIIREACEITDKILEEVFVKAKSYKTETELKGFIEDLMKKYDVKPSFPTIVASGKNSAIPHHKPGKDKLEGFTVLDLGINYKNYCSDISRTIYFGAPSEYEKEIYGKVLSVQKNCISMINTKTTFKEIHKYAEKILGKEFIHLIGHGLGIDVHELPNANSEEKLKENSIITIEPGVYFPEKYGIRIEDDVVVKDKPEILTKSTKELVVI